MKKRVSRHGGFTLVEIMIVVAIIGLLAAIAIPNFVKARATSQMNACINNLRQIDAACNEFALEKGKKSPAWGQLTSDERKQVSKLEYALNQVKGEDDYQSIRSAIDALNHGTMRLAELMMDGAVTTALKGKTMDEADTGEAPAVGHPVAKADFK